MKDENFVDLRMPFTEIDSRLTKETVTLIDKSLERIVGTKLYDVNNKLIQSILFWYDIETHSLKGIRMEEDLKLPSGQLIKKVTTTKIDNLIYKINL
ncbi:MAG: hypothetical protein V3U80_05550 [Flavobacteriaceae bacterium]